MASRSFVFWWGWGGGGALGALEGPAGAQGPPDYDIQWRTVGTPGNRTTLPGDVPFQPDLRIGSVSSSYRIAQTELTRSQWLEFVLAYAPFHPGSPNDVLFTGLGITNHGGGPTDYHVDPGTGNLPADAGWRYAARYANWLCHGKDGAPAAFESGAYDTTTFTADGSGSVNDQVHHTPGAQFWIPTRDEWTKAVYYDPDRYGPGQDGYWRYPNGTDNVLISGLPGEGGQTNAGAGVPFGTQLPVGSYPGVQSPWGLLDASGGLSEWIEDPWTTTGRNIRLTMGSGARDFDYPSVDLLGRTGPGGSVDGVVTHGIRIASAVPSPSSLVAVLLVPLFNRRQR